MREVLIAAAFALGGLAWPVAASAQRPVLDVGASAGSGLMLGAGQAETIVLRSPIFVDVSIRHYSDEEQELALGGSLRVEIDGRTSVAAVPRAELQKRVGPILLRPGVGVPLFFAPFSMLGVEGSVQVRLPVEATFAFTAMVMVDAFFFGSDVPEGSAVVMFNGAAGAELRF